MTPDDRLSAAERVGVDPAFYSAARRAMVRNIVLATCLGLIAGAIAIWVTSRVDPSDRPMRWWVWLAIFGLPILIIVVTAIFSWRRTTRLRSFQQAATVGPYGTVKEVRKALLRRESLRPDQRPAGQTLVNSLRRQTKRWWIWPILGVFWIALAFFSDSNSQRWFRIAIGVVYLILTLASWASRRRLLSRAAAQGLTPNPVVSPGQQTS